MTQLPLHVGLLQCGHVHPEVAADNGDYPELFADLLGHHGIELRTYRVTEGELPASTSECQGWLVSGSANSAYEDLPWIPPLEETLRSMVDDRSPMVAVCFGHQVLAQALGGRVAKSPEGWGVGIQRYELIGVPQSWMAPATNVVKVLASHQDQVVELPQGAELRARSAHCPIAAFTVGDSALAMQPHPEFTPAVSRGLLDRRRDAIGPPTADAALASLAEPADRDLVATWMARFLIEASTRVK